MTQTTKPKAHPHYNYVYLHTSFDDDAKYWMGQVKIAGKYVYTQPYPHTDEGADNAYMDARRIDMENRASRIIPQLEMLNNEGYLLPKHVDKIVAVLVTKHMIKPKIETICDIVCEECGNGVTPLLLQTKRRKRYIVMARQISMHFLKHYELGTLKNIGNYFGGFDHTTVIHSCDTVQKLCESTPEYRDMVTRIHNRIELSRMKKNIVNDKNEIA